MRSLLVTLTFYLCFRLARALATQSCWRKTNCTGPLTTAFSGDWNDIIYAPGSRTVSPENVLSLPTGKLIKQFSGPVSLSSEDVGLVFDFGVEVGGIVCINYEVTEGEEAILGLAFTEAKNYIGIKSDNSNGGSKADGALSYVVTSNGPQTYTIPDAKLRGGFRYLTLFLVSDINTTLKISNISLELSFQPTWSNLRAYQGYFYSNDSLVNKIWYAGAYTLQLNEIPPDTGRISVSSSRSGWQNDATIGPGATVLVDGAKRDRWVWIGDMGVAVPSAFLSLGDVESTKNALFAIYNSQTSDGLLPKAGPPYTAADSDTYHLWTLIGTYNYYLYTGDDDFLANVWPKYLKALTKSLGQINKDGIMSVKGTKDWGRAVYYTDQASVSMLLYRALKTGVDLTTWAPTLTGAAASGREWATVATDLQNAILTKFWDNDVGAFRDSSSNTDLHPQDANSMSIAFGVVPAYSNQARLISNYLASLWTPIGPACPELPGNISPFISSIEILSHFRAGNSDRAMKLIRDTWGYYLSHENGTESTVPEGFLVDGSWGYRGKYGYRNDPSYVSHAHGWSSGPTSALTEYAVGLRIAKPQGKAWQLRPSSYNELSEAQAGFTTDLGQFSASYTMSDGKMIVTWNTPTDTGGKLVLPGQKNKSVNGGKGSITVAL